MADTVQIGKTGNTAKIRHPVAVPVLSFITLGIYYIYWWYQVNREVVDLGRDAYLSRPGAGSNPGRHVRLFPWGRGRFNVVGSPDSAPA